MFDDDDDNNTVYLFVCLFVEDVLAVMCVLFAVFMLCFVLAAVVIIAAR